MFTINLLVMRRIIFVLMFCMLSDIYAQLPAGTKILLRPIEYRIPTETTALTLVHSGTDKGLEPWYVYSDKKVNWTLKEPGAIVPNKKMDYLQQFAVVEERGQFLRIAKVNINSVNPNTLEIDRHSEDFGWVKKNDVLMWTKCMVTDRGNIDRKAMIMNTLSLVASPRVNIRNLEDNAVNFYYDHSLRETTGRKAQLYEVFFAYKMTDTAVLVGNVARISDENEYAVKQSIMGWVPRNRVVLWDHRVAIEPNWESAAVSERRANKTRASVFASIGEAQRFQQSSSGANIQAIMDERTIRGDYYNDRMIGEWYRYPVYSEKAGIANIGVMGQIMTEKGEIDKVSKAEADREVRLASLKRRNINIVFVIDGTSSMGPYFKSISNAVVSGMEQLQTKYPSLKSVFRFGTVVYRDFAEKERLIEMKQLTSDYQDIARFLNRVDSRDIYDKDIPEAVYYGLYNALNGILTNNDETNLIVLVGDAGNHSRNDPSQIDQEEIIELIVEKNAGFLAYQVHNDAHPSYDEFRSQVQSLLMEAANTIYSQSLTSNAAKGVLGKPAWSKAGNNTLRLDNYINMASMVYAGKGQVMNPGLLTDEIVQLVDFAVQFTDQLIAGVSQIMTGGSSLKDVAAVSSPDANKYVSSFSPALVHFLYNQTKIPKDKLEYLVENKYQIFTDGFAPIRLQGQNEPHFRKVLLLSRSELGQVMSSIDRLYKAGNRNDRRIALQEAFVKMLERTVGAGAGDQAEDYMKMTIEEVNTRIFGLPGTNLIINKLRLEDLTNPGAISDADLQKYAREIELKYKDLQRIYNDSAIRPYKFSLTMAELVYYWIEDDKLP